MMQAVSTLSVTVGVVAACVALAVARVSYYRWRTPKSAPLSPSERKPSIRALSESERQQVLDTLNSERFADLAPPQVYATLLDEGTYLCSIRTMYRILDDNRMIRERRNQRRHPNYKKPELVATAPNQLWSWDITKLKGPATWTYYYLYVLLDVYSRYVVGWMVATQESAVLGQRLIEESIVKQGVDPKRLTIHSDRGSPMTAKSMALLLADLGVTKSHSRPRVSNDNPFSESHFKTLKYRPDFPDRFGSPEDSRAHGRVFFDWYNNQHYHSSLALFTPADVHYGHVETRASVRQEALDTAHAMHPERFVRKSPVVNRPPSEVWINRPQENASGPSTEDSVVVETPSSSSPELEASDDRSVDVYRPVSGEQSEEPNEKPSTEDRVVVETPSSGSSELKEKSDDKNLIVYRPSSGEQSEALSEKPSFSISDKASVETPSPAPSGTERHGHIESVEYRPLPARPTGTPSEIVLDASLVDGAIAMLPSPTTDSTDSPDRQHPPQVAPPHQNASDTAAVGDVIVMLPSRTSPPAPHGAALSGSRVDPWGAGGGRDASLTDVTDSTDSPSRLLPRQIEQRPLP